MRVLVIDGQGGRIGKLLIEGSDCLGIKLIHRIENEVSSLSWQRAGNQLQILQSGIIVALFSTDAQLFSRTEAKAAVVSRITIDQHGFVSLFTCQIQAVADQGGADSFALIVRQNAHRSEADHLMFCTC